MKILGLDFETTGSSTDTDRVIEIGAVIWDTERKKPIRLHQSLVRYAPDPVLSPQIVELTGISPIDLVEHGEDPRTAFLALLTLIHECEYIIAHNGTRFDRPIFEAEVKRLGLVEEAKMVAKTWIDTCTDVPYPEDVRTRKLSYLAAEHSFLNPFSHRALFDVLTMLTVLSHYHIETVATFAKSPLVYIQARVSYDDRDKAKSRGYRWDGDGARWVKCVREMQFSAEIDHQDFEVVRLALDDVPKIFRD